jgi:acetyltransferase
MSVRNLDSVFSPRSIAVIGASTRQGSVGQTVIRNLLGGGYKGPILPVNPKHTRVEGVPAYPGIGALPMAPDLAVICTPPKTVPEIISDLGARGTRAAVIITAGFGGSDGTEGPRLRQAMLDAAQPHLLRIIGPNCVGLQIPPLGLNASFAHLLADSGEIAVVTQSGAMATTIVDWAKRHSIGLSCMVSLGDMSDVDFGDVLDYLALSPDTRAILLYIEAATQARKFMSAARAASRFKPVIAIKAGRSAEGARAAASHTGAMASMDAVYDAAFERAGILRVDDIDELFAAVETIARVRSLPGDRLAIVTNGGGIGVLATDALIAKGGRLASLSPETMARLEKVLPPNWSRGNPIDLIGDADARRYEEALQVVGADPGVDATLVLNCPVAVAKGMDVARALVSVAQSTSHTFLASWLGGPDLEDVRRLFAAERIPSFETPRAAIGGFLHLIRHRRGQEAILEVPPVAAPTEYPSRSSVRRVIEDAIAAGRPWLNEREAKDLLHAYGVPVNRTVSASSPADAERAAQAMNTDRFVIKILSPDITHKSDVGGVILDLESPAAVRRATEAMLVKVAAACPTARLQGVTVQPMLRRPRAWELIVGMTVDPLFGPIVMFGQGGTAVEVIGDTALALPPLNEPLARALISRTRIARLLKGYRDRPPAKLDALVATLVKIGDLVADLPEIVELDINPVLLDESGMIAVDARVRVGPAVTSGTQRFAIRPYPRELEHQVELSDGSSLLIRPIRPEDEPGLCAMVERLTPEDVRFRFFSALKHLPHPLATRLTQIDYDREMAFVAAAPSDIGGSVRRGDLLGVSRLAADPDNEKAEFAVTVRSDFKGRGLGWTLMQHLIGYATARGIGMLHGAVLRDNEPMIKLCRDLGFSTEEDLQDPTIYQACRRLQDGSRDVRPQ